MIHFRHLLLCLMLFTGMSLVAKDRFVLVIDAGHGGHDSGALGRYSKEKDLTLKFAMAFGKMVQRNCPDVKVVYTRTTDRFLPLIDRANVANKNKADLFISVHINAIGGGRIARGFQTYTLGSGRNTGRSGLTKNLEVAKRENSVILLEKDYKQTYQGFDPNSSESNIMFEFIQDNNMQRSVELARLMQRNVPAATGRNDMGAFQDNLAVLRLSGMPGCLLELGFISTPDEEDFMNSPQAAELYARGIYNAFVQYRNKFYGTNRQTMPLIAVQTPATNQQQAEEAKKVDNEKKQPVVEKKQPVTEKKATPSVPPQQQQTVAPKQPATSAQPQTDKPVFKVQILANAQKLNKDDVRLKGLDNIDSYTENGLVKYTVGASEDYDTILALRRSLSERFPQAFVVAFINGKRTDIQQAIATAKKNKK